jgi:N-acetylglutamate synthase
VIQRVEEASLNAWPALQQVLLDGWVVRFAGGYTKRANSVTPLYPAQLAHDLKIAQVEQMYARRGLPVVFRLPSFVQPEALDTALAERGYRVTSSTRVMARALPAAAAGQAAPLHLLGRDEWLAIHTDFTGMQPPAVDAHRAILGAIVPEHALACLYDGDQPVACGVAVCEAPLVGLFDIVVAPTQRRRGLGRQLVDALIGWGQARGAEQAYLQVVAQNHAAMQLYEQLGFVELYHYWYRER